MSLVFFKTAVKNKFKTTNHNFLYVCLERKHHLFYQCFHKVICKTNFKQKEVPIYYHKLTYY